MDIVLSPGLAILLIVVLHTILTHILNWLIRQSGNSSKAEQTIVIFLATIEFAFILWLIYLTLT